MTDTRLMLYSSSPSLPLFLSFSLPSSPFPSFISLPLPFPSFISLPLSLHLSLSLPFLFLSPSSLKQDVYLMRPSKLKSQIRVGASHFLFYFFMVRSSERLHQLKILFRSCSKIRKLIATRAFSKKKKKNGSSAAYLGS